MTFQNAVYLDNNATTQLDPHVLEAMIPYLTGYVGNASSRHSLGRSARRAVDEAREKIACAVNCHPEEVYFTSGATESNNCAIQGLALPVRSTILVNPTEHPSALQPALDLRRRGHDVVLLRVDQSGVLAEPEPRLWSDASLLVVQHANSETGIVQDIVRLAELRPENCCLHVDITQTFGKTCVDFSGLHNATLSFSGHKIHGPAGVGALIVPRGTEVRAMLLGGEQQGGIRPGTEPIAAIVGLGCAVEIASHNWKSNAAYMAKLRDFFEEQIFSGIENVLPNGSRERRIPNTSNLSFLGAPAELLLIALDLVGVYASAGTACASGSLEPSPVLQAMGIVGERLDSAIRFSLSRFTTKQEIHNAVTRIRDVVQRVRANRQSTTGSVR